MKQSHWLLCVAKNCYWPRKITPLSKLTRAPLLDGMTNYSDSRIEPAKSTSVKENAGKISLI